MANEPVYVFQTTSGNPCDLCDVMEGEHDTPPHVPVHPHCECEVEILSPADSGDGDDEDEADEGEISFYEVRNVETTPADWTESFPYVDFADLPEDTPLNIVIELGLHENDLDDPLTLDDLDIDEPSGTESTEVTIPAHTTGSVEMEIVMTEYIVFAELWRVYTVTTEYVALVEEEHIDDIGGFVTFRSELAGATVNESPSDDGDSDGEGFLEEGDEVP